MTNLQKRILTSLIALPLSFYLIFKGGYFLLIFLLAIFLIANFELFTVFKKKTTIIFLNIVLILSLFSIHHIVNLGGSDFKLLLWLIILVILSDIGGYIFGKIFKWKKLTKISPKKTFSGVFGSLLFSLISIFFAKSFLLSDIDFFSSKFFILAIILSLIAQAGDLTISYLKRIEKIKDTGKILPGHGGIFDRIDGLMFVIIVGFILIKLNII